MSARLALSLTMALAGAALLAATAVGGSEAAEPRVLRLNISDMFWTSPPSAVITFRDYVEHFDVKRETRVLNLSVTWRFGNNEVAPSRRRTGGAEEERRRAGNGQG